MLTDDGVDLDEVPCRLLRDGTLELDLGEEDGPTHRVTPWEEGFDVHVRGRAVKHDPGVALFYAASLGHGPAPLQAFARGIPAAVLHAARVAGVYEWSALRMLRACEGVQDLATSAPNLLWLVAGSVAERDVHPRALGDVLRAKRPALLAWALEGEVAPEHVRFLEKLQLVERDAAERTRVLRALRAPEVVRAARHCERISAAALEELVDLPRALCDAAFVGDALRRGDAVDLRRAPELVRDCVRLAGIMGDNAHGLWKRPTVESLACLHDRWVAALPRRRPDLVRVLMEQGSALLPHAPLEASTDIVPIRTVLELWVESVQMAHCAYARLGSYRRGRAFVFRVLRPERATLEVRCVGEELVLWELRAAQNRPVSAETELAVRHWFEGQPGAAHRPLHPWEW